MFRIILTIGTLQTLAIAVNFIRTKLVAVMVGPEGVGIISTIDQVVQSAAYFSTVSLPFASVKFLSKAHSEGGEAFKRTYANFLKALLTLAIVGTVVVTSIVFFRPRLLGQEALKYKTLLLVAMLGMPTAILGGLFTQVFAAAQKYKHSSLLALITGVAVTTTSVIGIAAAGILGLYIGNVIAGALVTLGVLIYLRRAFDLPLYSRATSVIAELKHNPKIIPFSVMLYLASLTYSLSFLVVRYTVLKNYGEANAGLLQAAIALSLAIGLVLSPTNGLFLTPVVNRNIEKADKIKAAIDFEKKLVTILSLVSMPVVLFPHLVLTILFSTKFVVASQFVFLFVISQCVAQLAGIHQALLIGFDDLKAYSIMTCAGHISLGLLSWFMVASFGIFGISIAFITAYSIIFVSTFIRLKLKHGVSMPGNLWMLIAYGLSALLLFGAIFSTNDSWSPIMVASKIVVCMLFTLGLLCGLSKGERSALYGVLDRVSLKRREA
jgi:PST family polysaccharide transporter